MENVPASLARTPFHVILLLGDQSKSLRDSGAGERLLDATLAYNLNIPTQPLSIPMDGRMLDGCSIGVVTHNTTPTNQQRGYPVPVHQVPSDSRGIRILPTPPRGQLYSLSGPETNVMETYIGDYIGDSLAVCLLLPPGSTGFFSVEKKDRTLHPCID